MPQFHETQMGRQFFEGQVPKLIKALERIADALEGKNKQEEPQEVDVISDRSFTLGRLLNKVPGDTMLVIYDVNDLNIFRGFHSKLKEDVELYKQLQQFEINAIRASHACMVISLSSIVR